MSAKYFLRKRGLPVRTISRAHALELTPQQKQTLDDIHESFLGWCERLEIEPVNVEELMLMYLTAKMHIENPTRGLSYVAILFANRVLLQLIIFKTKI